jgi:hypothetical protein
MRRVKPLEQDIFKKNEDTLNGKYSTQHIGYIDTKINALILPQMNT